MNYLFRIYRVLRTAQKVRKPLVYIDFASTTRIKTPSYIMLDVPLSALNNLLVIKGYITTTHLTATTPQEVKKNTLT